MDTSGWSLVGQSIRGVQHAAHGLPNQDAIRYLIREETRGSRGLIILAVADGHGSRSSYASDIGSRLAVESACEICADISRYDFYRKNTFLDKKIKSEICRDIVRRWIEKVYHEIGSKGQEAGASPSPQGGEQAVPQEGMRDISPHLPDPNLVPYGTTILVAVITDRGLLFLQLGDGDILMVTSGGEVIRPIAADERLMANETTSLCLPGARDEFRVRYVSAATGIPAFILVSTDGYSNSFVDETAFLKVGRDILDILAENSDAVQERLEFIGTEMNRWLSRASECSGDDVTLGIICHVGTVKQYALRKKSLRAPGESLPDTPFPSGSQDTNPPDTLTGDPPI
jgi:serine/threonine protein phosphatase PrpC